MFIADYFYSLILRIFNWTFNFFYFWYARELKRFLNNGISFLRKIEKDIGIISNIKLITQPIFGDYSYIGRVIGPIFRAGRILIGFLIISVSFIVTISFCLIWIILPPAVFIMIILNLPYVF